MPTCADTCQRLLRRCLRWLALGCLGLAIALALLTGCQSRLIYFPHTYPAGRTVNWAAEAQGKVIDFTTAQGHQRAFLQGKRDHPRNLWLVCGGNGSLALDWSAWLFVHAPREDAWLLVDFPGYGECQGSPSPATIRDTFNQLVPLAMQEFGWSPAADSSRLRVFGHSLGAAACLIAAADLHIQRGVLLAPFTSTMDMSRRVTGLPLGFLVWQRRNPPLRNFRPFFVLESHLRRDCQRSSRVDALPSASPAVASIRLGVNSVHPTNCDWGSAVAHRRVIDECLGHCRGSSAVTVRS